MSERLDLLRPYLDKYERRFTVLDFGSGVEANQNIGQEIAREYNAVVVSVEKDWPDGLIPASLHTMVLKHAFTTDELLRLSECEHFDIVLALNIIHWFDNWKEIAQILLSMGDWVFLQIPMPSDITAPHANELIDMHTFFASLKRLKLLGMTTQFPGHAARPLWVNRGYFAGLRYLSRTHMDAHAGSATTDVSSDYRTLFRHMKGNIDQWIPAINLSNFFALGGVYPTKNAIVKLLQNFPLPEKRHGDITLHNFIFDGEQLYLVDGHEEWGGDDYQNIQLTIEKVLAS